jgi:hypothetical protein
MIVHKFHKGALRSKCGKRGIPSTLPVNCLSCLRMRRPRRTTKVQQPEPQELPTPFWHVSSLMNLGLAVILLAREGAKHTRKSRVLGEQANAAASMYAMYDKGAILEAVAVEHGCSREWVRTLFKRFGYPLRCPGDGRPRLHARRPPKVDRQKLLKAAQKTTDSGVLAAKFDTSRAYVTKLLREMGVFTDRSAEVMAQKRAQAIARRRAGEAVPRIAADLGVTAQTVWVWCWAAGLKGRVSTYFRANRKKW